MCIESIKEKMNNYIKSLEKDVNPDLENECLTEKIVGLNLAIEFIEDAMLIKPDYSNNQT